MSENNEKSGMFGPEIGLFLAEASSDSEPWLDELKGQIGQRKTYETLSLRLITREPSLARGAAMRLPPSRSNDAYLEEKIRKIG